MFQLEAYKTLPDKLRLFIKNLKIEEEDPAFHLDPTMNPWNGHNKQSQLYLEAQVEVDKEEMTRRKMHKKQRKLEKLHSGMLSINWQKHPMMFITTATRATIIDKIMFQLILEKTIKQ